MTNSEQGDRAVVVARFAETKMLWSVETTASFVAEATENIEVLAEWKTAMGDVIDAEQKFRDQEFFKGFQNDEEAFAALDAPWEASN